ncbi:hypothetical protein MXB_2773, partial [Myxobolus squamalis]
TYFVKLKRKPKTRKGKKYLESLLCEPERGIKKCLILTEYGCNQTTSNFLKEIAEIKFPDSEFMKLDSKLSPFDEPEGVIRFCEKCESSLFMMGTHNKKRPNNIILGKIYLSQA